MPVINLFNRVFTFINLALIVLLIGAGIYGVWWVKTSLQPAVAAIGTASALIGEQAARTKVLVDGAEDRVRRLTAEGQESARQAVVQAREAADRAAATSAQAVAQARQAAERAAAISTEQTSRLRGMIPTLRREEAPAQ